MPYVAIYYTTNNKEEPLNQLNNPTTIFGKKDSPYCILFGDSAGDSPLGAGMSCVLGYTYSTDNHGAQLVLKYSEKPRHREKSNGVWTNLEAL